MPTNQFSKREYRGINILLLEVASMFGKYSSPYWMTLKQANSLGGRIKPGEESTIVTFWTQLTVKGKDDDEKPKKIPLLRYYRVFNFEQTEDVPAIEDQRKGPPVSPINAAEMIVEGMPNRPGVEHKGAGRSILRLKTW